MPISKRFPRSPEDQVIYLRIMRWARQYLEDAQEDRLWELVNMYGIGEVNTTLLTDAIVYESGIFTETEAETVIDDETHPLHDAVIDAAEEHQEKHAEHNFHQR